MTSLSWLIYLVGMADPVQSFALWLCVPGTIGVIAILVFWLFVSINLVFDGPTNDTGKESVERLWAFWKKGRNLAVSIALIGWCMYVLVPSRQTLLLIAGAEIGNKVINSQGVQSVVDPGIDLLKQWMVTETSKLKSNEGSKK